MNPSRGPTSPLDDPPPPRSLLMSRLFARRPALVVFTCLLALGVSLPAAAEDMKIAYVDLQRALNEVDEGAAAKAALKKEFDAKQAELDKRQNELKAMKDEIDARGMMMTPEAKQEKAAEL